MKNHLGVILLIAAAAAGIIFAPIIAPIYWDEIPQYAIGQYSFNQYMSLLDSVFGTSLADPEFADFDNFHDRDYGPVFEVLLIALGKAAIWLRLGFGWDDLIVMRHIAVYLVFVLGTYGVYSIASRRLGSPWGGLLAAVLFFLSPRLFGNAFYNSKDIVFLSFFVLSVNFVLLAAEKRMVSKVLLAALFTALATSVRFIGIFTLFFGVFAWCVSWRRDGCRFRSIAGTAGGFVILTLLLVYAFYPFLWPSPVARIHDVVFAMSKFTRHNDLGIFNGEVVRSSEMPFYVPRWMA
ncbi:MAG: glycosyltransferase family 39 protein, partial [Succinivibrionaceae bacterium]|nr:glycosyltransferase family 39 protein [Succinivibrionaceae bacterium]